MRKELGPVVAAICLVIAGLGWQLGIASAKGWTNFLPPQFQIPTGPFQSISANSQGHLYITDDTHSRVLVYDNNGRFMRSWFVDAKGGGPFAISIDARDNIIVAAGRKKTVDTYDPVGRLIAVREDENAYSQMPNSKICTAPNGMRWEIIDSWLYPRIQGEAANGTVRKMISPPLWLWSFTGPLPLLVFWTLALGLVFWSRRP